MRISKICERQRNFAGGAGDQAECSKADGIKMGKREFPKQKDIKK